MSQALSRIAAGVALAGMTVVASCAHGLRQPKPVSLTTSLPSDQILNTSMRILESEGFEIVRGDWRHDVVQARITASLGALGSRVKCRPPEHSPVRDSVVTFNVVAILHAISVGKSGVTIGSSVTRGADTARSASAGSSTDCVSTGGVERRLAAAIQR